MEDGYLWSWICQCVRGGVAGDSTAGVHVDCDWITVQGGVQGDVVTRSMDGQDKIRRMDMQPRQTNSLYGQPRQD